MSARTIPRKDRAPKGQNAMRFYSRVMRQYSMLWREQRRNRLRFAGTGEKVEALYLSKAKAFNQYRRLSHA